ncbi:MAG: RHS repeat-associated protein, partial [Halioglobus sp.]
SAFGEEQIFNADGDAVEGSLVGNPWRYSSKRVDEETGLIFFGLRYYMPETGRWITRDPAGFADGPNLYAYVHGNPLKFCDLYGLTAREFAEAAGKSFAGGLKDMANGIKDLFTGTFNAFVDPSCDPEKSIQFAENAAACIENGTDYIQTHGVEGCLGQVGNAVVDGANATIKDFKEGDDRRKGEMVGGFAAYLSPGAIFKGFKWLKSLGRLGEGLEVAGASAELESMGVDKWSRLPKSIQDQMTLKAAQEGQGNVIIKSLNDPKFKGMEKMELKIKSANGSDSVVHYVRNPKTESLMDFKFKNNSID